MTFTCTSGNLEQPVVGDEAPARRAGGDLGEPAGGADAELLAGGHADEPQLSGDVAHSPVGGGPGRGGRADPVQRGRGGHAAVRAVEEVAPQRGRLHAKRRRGPDGRRGGCVAGPVAHDEAIRGHVAQGVAPVGERIDVDGGGRRRRESARTPASQDGDRAPKGAPHLGDPTARAERDADPGPGQWAGDHWPGADQCAGPGSIRPTLRLERASSSRGGEI